MASTSVRSYITQPTAVKKRKVIQVFIIFIEPEMLLECKELKRVL